MPGCVRPSYRWLLCVGPTSRFPPRRDLLGSRSTATSGDNLLAVVHTVFLFWLCGGNFTYTLSKAHTNGVRSGPYWCWFWESYFDGGTGFGVSTPMPRTGGTDRRLCDSGCALRVAHAAPAGTHRTCCGDNTACTYLVLARGIIDLALQATQSGNARSRCSGDRTTVGALRPRHSGGQRCSPFEICSRT